MIDNSEKHRDQISGQSSQSLVINFNVVLMFNSKKELSQSGWQAVRVYVRLVEVQHINGDQVIAIDALHEYGNIK